MCFLPDLVLEDKLFQVMLVASILLQFVSMCDSCVCQLPIALMTHGEHSQKMLALTERDRCGGSMMSRSHNTLHVSDWSWELRHACPLPIVSFRYVCPGFVLLFD